MLVLSRKRDEALILRLGGDVVRVVVIDIGRTPHGKKRVRLGIEAPRHVTVNRSEIQDQIDGKEAGV